MALADQEHRNLALNPAQSFIVQAPAGSGKTGLLIRRYLKLLTVVEQPEEIVAITFTRKAASEMRDRILEALRGEADDDDVRVLADAARSAAVEKGWELELNPSRLRVLTIDGFCFALTRQMPWTAGFGAPPGLTDEAETLYLDAARNALALLDDSNESWRSALTVLLAHFDNNFQQVEAMLAGMLARRDQWAREIVGSGGDERISREILEDTLSRVVKKELGEARDAFPPAAAGELLALAGTAGQWLSENEEHVSDSNRPMLELVGLTSLPEADDYARWQALLTFCFTATNQWRKSPGIAIGFPAQKITKDLEPAKKRFKEVMQDLQENHESLRQDLDWVRGLPNPQFDDAQWQMVEALTQVLPLALAQLRLVFTRAGEVDFTEVLLRSKDALIEDDDAPTDLALKLDHRIAHILVDEFQDTSSSQEELVRALTRGWNAGPDEGRTLFLVGDPMQSIYRFRKADVGLFVKAAESGIGDVALGSLKLSVNFRSVPAIIEWVNQTFRTIMPDEADPLEGAVPLEDSEAFRSGDGAVEFYPFTKDQRNDEAARVVEIVQAAIKDPDHSVAILIKARSHMREITPALNEAGIPFQGMKLESLAEQPVVQDLMALTRLLLHPADRVAWLATLRAPWCGLTLADLSALIESDRSATVASRLENLADFNNVISEDGMRRLQKLQSALSQALAVVRRGTLRRGVERLWVALEGPACVDRKGLADAATVLDLVETLETGCDIADISELEAQVSLLFASPDLSTEQVQVMTIHQSKGLEFDTVIVPGLGNSSGRNTAQLLNLQEVLVPNESGGEVRVLLSPPKPTGGEDDPLYKWLGRLDKRRGDFETQRLLYVACTRAKRFLHLLGSANWNSKDESWSAASNTFMNLLWDRYGTRFDALDPPEDAGVDEEEPTGIALKRLPVDFKSPAPHPSIASVADPDPDNLPDSIEYSWASENARQVGTVVHDALMRVAEDGPEEWTEERIGKESDNWSAALRRVGILEEDLQKSLAKVGEAVNKALDHERGRWILDDGHQSAHSEYPLTGVIDDVARRIVIDRTFVDDEGTRWVVDYKTSSHEGGDLDEFLRSEKDRYSDQLERYASFMAKKDPGRKIRVGLYFPLLQRFEYWEPNI